MRLQECAAVAVSCRKVETGFLTTVCCCAITVLTGRESWRRVPCSRSQAGKSRWESTQKTWKTLKLSNILAKRREDEGKKKGSSDAAPPRCHLSRFTPSPCLHARHVSNPSHVEGARLLKTRHRQRFSCSQHIYTDLVQVIATTHNQRRDRNWMLVVSSSFPQKLSAAKACNRF